MVNSDTDERFIINESIHINISTICELFFSVIFGKDILRMHTLYMLWFLCASVCLTLVGPSYSYKQTPWFYWLPCWYTDIYGRPYVQPKRGHLTAMDM